MARPKKGTKGTIPNAKDWELIRKFCLKKGSAYNIAFNKLYRDGIDPFKHVDLWFDTADKIKIAISKNPEIQQLANLVQSEE